MIKRQSHGPKAVLRTRPKVLVPNQVDDCGATGGWRGGEAITAKGDLGYFVALRYRAIEGSVERDIGEFAGGAEFDAVRC